MEIVAIMYTYLRVKNNPLDPSVSVAQINTFRYGISQGTGAKPATAAATKTQRHLQQHFFEIPIKKGFLFPLIHSHANVLPNELP